MNMDRQLIGQSSPDGSGTFQPKVTGDESYRQRLLIRRELRNGGIQWFDTAPRGPRPDELIDPRIAAALQLGYLTREARLFPDSPFGSIQVAVGYLADEISSPEHREFQRIYSGWRDGNEVWRGYHHYKLTGTADCLLAAEHDLRIWYDIGTLVGDCGSLTGPARTWMGTSLHLDHLTIFVP